MTLHWAALDDLVDAVLERRLTDGPLAVAVLTHALLDRRHRDTAS
jgi:hypothetical protein